MVNPSLTMSEDNVSPKGKLRIASHLIGCSEGTMKIADAMEVAGYLTPERRGGTIYQRFRQAGKSISKKIEDGNDRSIPLSVTLTERSSESLSVQQSISISSLLSTNRAVYPASSS